VGGGRPASGKALADLHREGERGRREERGARSEHGPAISLPWGDRRYSPEQRGRGSEWQTDTRS
jgi:hypothetical protein